jgi:hypothetical protein
MNLLDHTLVLLDIIYRIDKYNDLVIKILLDKCVYM